MTDQVKSGKYDKKSLILLAFFSFGEKEYVQLVAGEGTGEYPSATEILKNYFNFN